MKNQSNFLNSVNYYKNRKAEKKYFTENFSNKFLNFFEKFSLVIIGLIVNFLLFKFFKLINKDETSSLAIFIIYIIVFIFLNGYLSLAFNIKVEKLINKETILLKRFINYKETIIQFSLKLYFLILFLILGFILCKITGENEIKILILNFLYGILGIQAFLLRIGSGQHIKNGSHTIRLLKTIIVLIFFGLIFLLQKIIEKISNIFAFIFYPLLKISLKNKKFYNLEVNGNIFIKKGKNIILITKDKNYIDNSYIKNPLGNL